MTVIRHIAGYRFVRLIEADALHAQFLRDCPRFFVQGTILLSPEGINLMLAGLGSDIEAFKAYLDQDKRFQGMTFHETDCTQMPFTRLYVKLKSEIIPVRQPAISPEHTPAKSIDPKVFKQWLDEGKDMAVLDTRNYYEVWHGTFKRAINPNLKNFMGFDKAIDRLDPALKEKPIVMFCTGGVRCEKAALLMAKKGFKAVYQLKGGILNYFKTCGGAHYRGNCFVFDQRIALTPMLTQAR